VESHAEDSFVVESAREKLLLGVITKEEFLTVIASDAAKKMFEHENNNNDDDNDNDDDDDDDDDEKEIEIDEQEEVVQEGDVVAEWL